MYATFFPKDPYPTETKTLHSQMAVFLRLHYVHLGHTVYNLWCAILKILHCYYWTFLYIFCVFFFLQKEHFETFSERYNSWIWDFT